MQTVSQSSPNTASADGNARSMDSTASLLAERQKTHGSFATHARVTQDLKEVIKGQKFDTLKYEHQEALHMILHKIGRIIAGNPNFKDHWDDIAGYAKLGSEACE